jgi:hypothetical protein
MDTTSHNEKKKSEAWFFILGIGLIALFLLATNLFRGGYSATTDPEDSARDAERVKNLADLQAENEKKLNSYAWVDQAKGSVQIPINQAMTLVLAKLNSTKPAPAYPVVDNTGQPVPPTRLATPAGTADTSDDLPQGKSDADAGANALAAPVDKTEAKAGKTKKSKTQQ